MLLREEMDAMTDDVEDALQDALLHHDAELVLLGQAPMDEKEALIFAVGFMQGVQFERTGDWRLEDE
jgi:hypothetical protein